MGKVTLYFFNPKRLGQIGSLEHVFETVIKLGFSDIKEIWVGHPMSEEGTFAEWRQFSQDVIDGLNIAYDKGKLQFFVMDDHKDDKSLLTLWFKFQWEYKRNGEPTNQEFYAFSKDSQFFSQLKEKEFYAQRLLSVGREMYKILEPEFGWIERLGQRGYTSKKDVSALSIPHIYWANFFGPEYVEKYGLEFFQNAPGWRKDVLDKGFLYVLSPHMGTKRRDMIGTEVKSYFGIDSVRMEKRK